MPLLYYWTRNNYRLNMADGPYYHLSSKEQRMHDIDIGDSLWALTNTGPDHYALAAHLVVKAKSFNLPGYEYGPYRLDAELDSSRYFRVDNQPNIEQVIRQLSCKTNAAVLGRSFQGPGSVRILKSGDHERLMQASKHLDLYDQAITLASQMPIRQQLAKLAGDKAAH